MKNIIRQIKPFCRGLTFTGGGEPLCNDDTLEAIEYAKKSGMDVALVTNGDLLNQEKALKIVKNCTYIRVSYMDDETSNKLKLLVEAREKAKSNCTIGVSMLTNKERAQLMKRFVAQAKKSKADYAQFRPFHLDMFDARKIIGGLQKGYDNNNFKIITSGYKYENMEEKKKGIKKYNISFADNFRTVIASDGKIYPDCFTRGMENFSLGDLKKDSFAKIWRSKRRKRISETKLDQKNCPPMCYHDPLSELLWDIWRQYQEGDHANFV